MFPNHATRSRFAGQIAAVSVGLFALVASTAALAQGAGVGPATTSIAGYLRLEGIDYYAHAQNINFEFRPADTTAAFTKTVAVDASGAFRITGIPERIYQLHIKGAKYLANNVPLNLKNGSVTDLDVRLRAGDANNDNIVDTTDFGILIGEYGDDVSALGTVYEGHADFNGDGVVDVTDFGLLVGNYGEVGDK